MATQEPTTSTLIESEKDAIKQLNYLMTSEDKLEKISKIDDGRDKIESAVSVVR